jgi:hypothetical protein
LRERARERGKTKHKSSPDNTGEEDGREIKGVSSRPPITALFVEE